MLAPIERPAGGTAFLNPVGRAYLLTVAVFWLCAVGTQVVSWRRSSGERRQQLKWLASGAAVCGLRHLGHRDQFGDLGGADRRVHGAAGQHRRGNPEVPAVRHRPDHLPHPGLRDRHRPAGGVYAGLVLLATRVLPVQARWRWRGRRWRWRRCSTRCAAGSSGSWTGGSTGPVTTPDRTVAAFAARLQDAVDLDSVRDDLAGVVQQALEPAHVSVWINQPD